MNKDKKTIIFVALILLIVFFVIRSSSVKKNSTQSGTVKNVSDQETKKEPEKTSGEIIKCQNTVTAPATTVQLYTYTSGNKVRLDYRVGTMDETTSNKNQALYDGSTLYVWSPAMKYSNEKVENPNGVKNQVSGFDLKIDLSVLDTVDKFNDSKVWGDRICMKWDDVDSSFEVPTDVRFDQSGTAETKLKENMAKTCEICNQIMDETAKTSCKKYLLCYN